MFQTQFSFRCLPQDVAPKLPERYVVHKVADAQGTNYVGCSGAANVT
jgi:hypothetical protein